MSVLARGTKVYIGSGTEGETFAEIENCNEISWSGVSYDTEDVSVHSNPLPVREMVTTLYSNGTVDLGIIVVPGDTELAALRTLSQSGEARNFQLEHVGDVEHVEFSGYVTGFTYESAIDATLKAKVSILVNGAFTPVV